ncbi:MAG: T9SS type A sorting domain-containing protein [Bacteroidaceae bacterium]|nr:T9SS type A sorting domain-containing protein [Bacteroidaceae bacterium]
MRKPIFIFLLFASCVAASVHASGFNGVERDEMESEVSPVSIVVNGAQVRVANAEGQMLEVYNLAGVRVAVVKIDSEDKTINLNLAKGCYILRVGNTARKVSVR